MIRHIVMFQLKDNSPENVSCSKEILKSMKGKVPEVLELEVGADILHSNRSYDLALSVLVGDKEALERYQNDKYHVSVVKTHMHAVRESSISVDYEI